MVLPEPTPPAAEPAPTPANTVQAASDSAATPTNSTQAASDPVATPAKTAQAASDPAAAPGAPNEVQGYCVKCKAPRTMVQVQIVTTQNKRRAAKGKCPVCGTTMNKFLPK